MFFQYFCLYFSDKDVSNEKLMTAYLIAQFQILSATLSIWNSAKVTRIYKEMLL